MTVGRLLRAIIVVAVTVSGCCCPRSTRIENKTGSHALELYAACDWFRLCARKSPARAAQIAHQIAVQGYPPIGATEEEVMFLLGDRDIHESLRIDSTEEPGGRLYTYQFGAGCWVIRFDGVGRCVGYVWRGMPTGEVVKGGNASLALPKKNEPGAYWDPSSLSTLLYFGRRYVEARQERTEPSEAWYAARRMMELGFPGPGDPRDLVVAILGPPIEEDTSAQLVRLGVPCQTMWYIWFRDEKCVGATISSEEGASPEERGRWQWRVE